MLKDGTSARELFLMHKIAPDAWQVVTVEDGEEEYGDFLDENEALIEYIECATDEEVNYDHVYIIPVWNDAVHDEIQP
mgnify:CR=1 FL=1